MAKKKTKRRGPGRPFTGRDDPRNAHPAPAVPRELPLPPLPAGGDELAEMEAVLREPPAPTDSPLRKKLRREFDERFTAFMDRLEKKRAEHKRGEVVQSPGADPGYAEYLAWKKKREAQRNVPWRELMQKLIDEAKS